MGKQKVADDPSAPKACIVRQTPDITHIVGALQIQPELGGGAKPVAQPQRRVAGNSGAFSDSQDIPL
jgi:hypothetical protein